MSGLEKKHTENEGREKEKHKKDKKGKKRKKSSQNKNMTAEKLSKLDDATGEGFYQQSYQAKQSQSVAPYTHAVASTSQMSVERERVSLNDRLMSLTEGVIAITCSIPSWP